MLNKKNVLPCLRPEHLHSCVSGLSALIKAAFSLNLLCFLCVFVFPDSLFGGSSLRAVVLSVWFFLTSCFPPHLSWWPLTTHLSCKIFTRHFSSPPWRIFRFFSDPISLPSFLTPCSSAAVCLSLQPLSFPSLSLLFHCFLFDFQPCLLVAFFPTISHLCLFCFTLLVSPLPVVSTFSPSHSFSTLVSLYLTSEFPRYTLTCHHHNLLLAQTSPYLLPSPLSFMPPFFPSFAPFPQRPHSH